MSKCECVGQVDDMPAHEACCRITCCIPLKAFMYTRTDSLGHQSSIRDLHPVCAMLPTINVRLC